MGHIVDKVVLYLREPFLPENSGDGVGEWIYDDDDKDDDDKDEEEKM